jgi:hypothetical protein
MNALHPPTKLRISVERYQKMVATGVLTSADRVELIEGEIVAGRTPADRGLREFTDV